MDTFLAGAALVVAVLALAVAGMTWRSAPGARLWMELRTRIEDAEWDLEQMHAQRRRHASQQNAEKATTARVAKQTAARDVLAEAAEIAAAAGAGKQRTLPGMAHPAGDPEAELALWRRRAGLH